MSNRRVRRFKGPEGDAKVAILGPAGRLWTKACVVDAPVRMVQIANGDVERYCSEFPNAPAPRKACKEMLRIGRGLGITKGAKQFLRRVEV